MTKNGAFFLAMVWAFLVVGAIHFLDFPGSVPRFKQVSGGGVLLDVSPVFQVETTYQRLASYGQAGRESYAFRNLTVDILLPLSMFPFLFLFMRRALTSFQLAPGFRLFLLSFSFGYVLFDLAENAVVLAILNVYPERLQSLAVVLPYLTVVKRAASILALVVPLIIFTVKLFRRRTQPEGSKLTVRENQS